MNLKKGALYVLFANIINLIISLFTGFVLPKYLSIETYSSIKLFQLYITYTGILHLGFSDGMYLQHGGKSINDVNKEEVVSELHTFRIFQIIITFIAIIISILIKNEMLLFCSLVILPINTGNYFRSLYQAIGEFKKYSRFTNINTLLIFIINLILLLIVKSDNYYVYIIAYIIAYVIYWLLLERENKKIFGKYIAKSNIEYLKRNIKSGFFLMIGNFCNVIFTSIDRIFVQNLLGAIKFAYYSFAVSVENLMNVLITPISTVMYNYLCNNNEVEKVKNLKKIILLFATVIIAVIFPAKFLIDLWITKYKESITVLFFLFAAQFISIIVKSIHINLYKAEKKQKRYFVIMLTVVVLSIILNIIFFNINKSIEMIALATFITNIIWFIIGEFDFKKYKLKIREYIYMFLVLITFLIAGRINNAIIGCVIYILVAFVLVVTLMRDTFKYCLNEIIKYVKKAINKVKKEEK